MTKQIAVSLYDKKAQTYSSIGLYPNSLVALRDFSELCKNKESMVSKYPEDYELHTLGVFDNHEGTFNTGKEVIGKASDYAQTEK